MSGAGRVRPRAEPASRRCNVRAELTRPNQGCGCQCAAASRTAQKPESRRERLRPTPRCKSFCWTRSRPTKTLATTQLKVLGLASWEIASRRAAKNGNDGLFADLATAGRRHSPDAGHTGAAHRVAAARRSAADVRRGARRQAAGEARGCRRSAIGRSVHGEAVRIPLDTSTVKLTAPHTTRSQPSTRSLSRRSGDDAARLPLDNLALEKIDPADAWQPWQPSPADPWDRKWAGHLYRRAVFGASGEELAAGRETRLRETLELLLSGDPRRDGLVATLNDIGRVAATRDPTACNCAAGGSTACSTAATRSARS